MAHFADDIADKAAGIEAFAHPRRVFQIMTGGEGVGGADIGAHRFQCVGGIGQSEEIGACGKRRHLFDSPRHAAREQFEHAAEERGAAADVAQFVNDLAIENFPVSAVMRVPLHRHGLTGEVLFETGNDLFQGEGFGHVGVHAGAAPGFTIAPRHMGGKRHDRRVATGDRQGFIGADFAGGAVAVHVRHAAIHENEIGLHGLPRIHGFAPVDRDRHGDAELAQHFDDDLAVHRIVIGYENVAAREACLHPALRGAALQQALAAQPAFMNAGDHVGDILLAERQDHQIVGLAGGNRRLAIRLADGAQANDARAGPRPQPQGLQAARRGEDGIGARGIVLGHRHLEARCRQRGAKGRLRCQPVDGNRRLENRKMPLERW